MRSRSSALLGIVGAALLVGGCRGEPDPVDDTDAVDSDVPVAAAWAPWARRLAARELRHAFEDLAGPGVVDGISFPDDPTAGGFDDVLEVATIDPLLVERLDLAASRAADALAADLFGPARVLSPDASVTTGCPYEDPSDQEAFWHTSWEEVPVTTTVQVTTPGRYRVELPAMWRGPGAGAFELRVDDVEVGSWSAPSTIEFAMTTLHPVPAVEVTLSAGAHEVTWVNRTPEDLSRLSADAVPCGVAAAWLVKHVAITGPLPEGCDDGPACGAEAVARWAARAWRRPITGDEQLRFRATIDGGLDAGAELVDAVAGAAHAVLLSPSFLVVSDGLVPEGDGYRLDDASIAGRLALLVWSSLPDEALIACAEAGTLLSDDATCGLDAQLARMLADPRAARFAEGLAPQWLRLARSPSALPPGEDVDFEALYADMRAEAVALVQAALDDAAAPLDDLLDADVGWTTTALAGWYGAGGGQPLDLAALGRQGLVGLGGVHVSTATSGIPSPVKRGVWVREVLLCDPPKPPPAGVPALELSGLDEGDALAAFEAHASQPACSTCHAAIDPIGTALLGYDAFGRVRPSPLPPTALPDGTLLQDAAAVRAFARQDDRFARCATAAVATYALGRVVEVGHDDERLAAWLHDARARGGSVAALLGALVRSDAFLRRTPEEG